MKTVTFTEFRRNATACITAVEKGETIWPGAYTNRCTLATE